MRSTQCSKEVQEKSFLISASINSALKAGIIHQSFFPVSFLQKSMGLFSHATNYKVSLHHNRFRGALEHPSLFLRFKGPFLLPN